MLHEHLTDNEGEVLPHPLMSAYERWAEHAAQRNDPALRPFLDAIDVAYATAGDEIQELISVSFLENLPRPDNPGCELRALLGPHTTQQLHQLG